MEDLTFLAPEAHQHLQNINPKLREEIGKDILSLSHMELVSIKEDSLFEMAVEKREDVGREQVAPQLERVDTLMTRSAGWLRVAHESSTEPLDVDPYKTPSRELFERAKEQALLTADVAKQAGDFGKVHNCMEDFLVLGLLSDRNGQSSSQTDVERVVSCDLAVELIDAAGNLKGVIALVPFNGYTDASRRLKPQVTLIEAASGLEVSDDFQNRAPLAPTAKDKLCEELEFNGITVLARAAEHRHDHESATALSLQAVDKLATIQYGAGNSKKVAGTLRLAAQLCAVDSRPVAHEQLITAATRLGNLRSAGLKPYRTNNPLADSLDRALVELVADNKLDVASALLSSSVHEISSLDNPKANHDYNLNYVLKYGCDVAEADRPQIVETLLRLHEAKQDQFRQTLTRNGASDILVDTLITNAISPETATAVDPAFWETYDSQPLFVKARFEGRNGGVHDLGGLSIVVQALEATGLASETTNTLLNEVLGSPEGLTKINDLTRVLRDAEFKRVLESEDFGPQLLRRLIHHDDVGLRAEQIRDVLLNSSFGKHVTTDGIASKQALNLIETVIESGSISNKATELGTILDDPALQSILKGKPYGVTMLMDIAAAADSLARANQLIAILSEPKFEQQLEEAGYSGTIFARVVIAATEPEAKAAAVGELLDDHYFRELLDQSYSPRLINDITNSRDILSRGKQIIQSFSESGLAVQLAEGKFGAQFARSIVETVLRAETPELKAVELSSLLDDPAFQQLLSQSYGTNLLTHVAAADESLLVGQRLTRVISQTKFGEYISDNGIAAQLANSLLHSVMTSENPEQLAEAIGQIFDGGGSLWHTTSQLAELAVGVGSFYSKGARTGRIPLSLPVRNQKQFIQNAVIFARQEEMRETLGLYGVAHEVINDAEANGWRVAIDKLPPELQQTLLVADLYEAITLSRDPSSKSQATVRNQVVNSQSVWQPGSLHHFTERGNLAALLINGNLPGELVVDRIKADSFPFNLDLVELSSAESTIGSYAERLQKLASNDFGDVCIHFIRAGSDYRLGEEFEVEGSYNGQHRLMPGGLPSTQISAFTLKDDAALPAITEAILEASFYVPVFSKEGVLTFSYEDYQALRHDRNYDVVVPELVDTTFERPNSQAGSNEGAEFIVPAENEGQAPSRYYCKFAKLGADQHIWSELLADSIYRAVDAELVPETRPVILEGRLARASKITVLDEQLVTDEARCAGFILDCLVGNWDATYNGANLVMSDGHALRVDTGNALYFKAMGEHKAQEDFSGEVQELDINSDPVRPGNGLRQNYPGLTEESIRQQVAALEARLTDYVIDSLVDGVRLPAAERRQLKNTLRDRRDNIINRTRRLPIAA